MPILPYIAAAAAKGFELSLVSTTPRSATQWVAHCRSAATAAADELRSNPPLKDPDADVFSRGRRTLGTLVQRLEEMADPGETEEAHAARVAGIQRNDDELLSGQDLENACRSAASAAFRAAMPLLTSKTAVRAFVACVGAGTGDGHIMSQDAKALLYSAQLAIAAYKGSEIKRGAGTGEMKQRRRG